MKLPSYFATHLMSFRNYLSFLNERVRYIDNHERFILFATVPFAIPGNGRIEFNTVQGFRNDIVLTHLFPECNVVGTTNAFTFNFQITGSQEWFFSQDVWRTTFFYKSYPIVFPCPILLKSGSGLSFRCTDTAGRGSSNQFVFGGYKTEAKEV